MFLIKLFYKNQKVCCVWIILHKLTLHIQTKDININTHCTRALSVSLLKHPHIHTHANARTKKHINGVDGTKVHKEIQIKPSTVIPVNRYDIYKRKKEKAREKERN